MNIESARIVSRNCVNSKWIARFLAREDQECCQCSFGDCKVAVEIASNGHKPYKYILTEDEIRRCVPELLVQTTTPHAL